MTKTILEVKSETTWVVYPGPIGTWFSSSFGKPFTCQGWTVKGGFAMLINVLKAKMDLEF